MSSGASVSDSSLEIAFMREQKWSLCACELASRLAGTHPFDAAVAATALAGFHGADRTRVLGSPRLGRFSLVDRRRPAREQVERRLRFGAGLGREHAERQIGSAVSSIDS